MDEYLAFGNGQEVKGKARQNDDILFVYLEDKTMDLYQAFALLSVQENVEKIRYHYYKADLIFEGYTRITLLNDDGNRITAILVKDGANDGSN